MIQSKKLLMQNFVSNVTLTVSTNPASATCTLTYNGQSYETKSAIVPKGTTINYTIYHATYGTETGSITMDDNKTLTCNGTYSTSSNGYINNTTLYGNATFNSSTSAITNFTTTTSYALLPSRFHTNVLSQSTNCEIVICFTSSSTSGTRYVWSEGGLSNIAGATYTGYGLQLSNAQCHMVYDPYTAAGRNGITICTAFAYSANTKYWVKFQRTSSSYNLYYSTNGSSWISSGSYSLASALTAYASAAGTVLGGEIYRKASASTNLTIHLDDCYINKDSSRWWTGATQNYTYTYYWEKSIT